MGAHFGLRLVEGLAEDEVLALGVQLVGTSSHGGEPLPRACLPRPAAWLLGHEGQGVSPRLLAACTATVGIPQPGGEESLNVAAAAAICFYEVLRRAQGEPALPVTLISRGGAGRAGPGPGGAQ
jgi:TrmH family RNA methyltransferase